MTYDYLCEAVNSFFSNRSLSNYEIKDGLETIREEIDLLLEALESDGEED